MTPYEVELLACLIEECAEIQQDSCKALRFGLEDAYNSRPNARTRIGEEIGDLLCVIDHLLEARLVDQSAIDHGHARKKERLAKYLRHKPAEDPKTTSDE